ncbi:unnamed protein product [Penicillium pancosmium]
MPSTATNIPISSTSQADTSFMPTLLHEIDHAPWKLILQTWTLAFAVLSPLLLFFWITVDIKYHYSQSDSKARASSKSSAPAGFDFGIGLVPTFKSCLKSMQNFSVSNSIHAGILAVIFVSFCTHVFASFFNHTISSGVVSKFLTGFSEFFSIQEIGNFFGGILLFFGGGVVATTALAAFALFVHRFILPWFPNL